MIQAFPAKLHRECGRTLLTSALTLAKAAIDAYLPDNGYRRRDERYAGQEQHKDKPDPLWDKRPKEQKKKRFSPADFKLAEDGSHCTCPAGKRLYSNGSNCMHLQRLRRHEVPGSVTGWCALPTASPVPA